MVSDMVTDWQGQNYDFQTLSSSLIKYFPNFKAWINVSISRSLIKVKVDKLYFNKLIIYLIQKL
jgi:hypothetical protein